jgi:hypothetical protein
MARPGNAVSDRERWRDGLPDSPVDEGDVKKGVEYGARAGYTAKGLVYGIVGALAVMTALGFGGGRIVGTESAVESLRTQPFGQVMLWLVALGLVGYVVWRFVQAILDPEHKGDDASGIARRIGLAISGLVYASLALFTFRLLLGDGGSGGSGGSQESTGTLMQYEWGIWVVGAIGVGFIGVALYQLYRAWAVKFDDNWKSAGMDPTTRTWSVRLSRFGIAARAVAFALIGWFFIQAALQSDPSEAKGLDGALRTFYEQPYGQVWLGVIGLGLLCYGIYCVLNARFRRINP